MILGRNDAMDFGRMGCVLMERNASLSIRK